MADSLKMLGVTFQSNCRFNEHVKSKLAEANRGLYILRCLRKEGYTQDEVDYFFCSVILPKITYGLSIYAASPPELTVVHNFLRRCFKRKYISYHIDIQDLVDKTDHTIYKKVSNKLSHPLFQYLPKTKQSSHNLRNKSSLLPRVNTERFKNSFINRLYFKHRLAI